MLLFPDMLVEKAHTTLPPVHPIYVFLVTVFCRVHQQSAAVALSKGELVVWLRSSNLSRVLLSFRLHNLEQMPTTAETFLMVETSGGYSSAEDLVDDERMTRIQEDRLSQETCEVSPTRLTQRGDDIICSGKRSELSFRSTWCDMIECSVLL